MGVQAFRNLIQRGEPVGVVAIALGAGSSRCVGSHREPADPAIPTLKEAKADYSKLQ